MIIIKTSRGDIRLQLDPENTPVTTANFLRYVREGFYNETIFHRVIGGFMIQGGGFTVDMHQKAGHAPIVNEAKTGQLNKRGTIAMARTMDPHSATSQFFINVGNNIFLNYTDDTTQGYGYCVFGEVVEGLDVVEAISKVRTTTQKGHGDVPVEAVVIHEIYELEEE